MADDKVQLETDERELDYAYLRVSRPREEVDGFFSEHGFARFVRTGVGNPANTVSGECHVDYDAQGNVIGITWFTGI